MACTYCGQRKGKRSCPALGGSICSGCCGQHRLSKIKCPSDCVHLGALSVGHDASVSFTQDDYNGAVESLFEFSRVGPADRSVGELFEGKAAEWEVPILSAYVLYGHRDDDGKRLVDRFLATRGRLLTTGRVSALRALQNARASLLEIEEVQVGSGFDAVDVLSGAKLHVREVAGTAQLKKWDVVFAWVMSREGHFELTGASCLLPRAHLDVARTALEHALDKERDDYPGVADRDLVGSVVPALVRALRAAYQQASMPELRTTDGQELVFCKSHFAARDQAAVRARLARLVELEPDDTGSFVWLDRGRDKRPPGPPTVLGRITIEPDGLVLQTMSKERADRGRELLQRTLGAAITHRADTIQDVQAAMKSHRGNARQMTDEMPDEAQREAIGNYLRDYYLRWLDEPVPALANKSPRKAVRTKRGRVQVAALLKDIENGTLSQPGGASVDFAALRRELGLYPESA